MKIKDAKWEMTDDYIGMKPKFRVICSDCMWNDFFSTLGQFTLEWESFSKALIETWARVKHRFRAGEFDMRLREAFCSPLPTIGEKAYHNDMHYKCCKSDGCDRVKVFGVPVDKEYYEELMKRRKGEARVQPRDQWEEDEEMKKQLEGIGYL
jgi:hypothetical protein